MGAPEQPVCGLSRGESVRFHEGQWGFGGETRRKGSRRGRGLAWTPAR